ncbi:MAG: VWA domain-containing protein [Myxococcales bacterium]|nr:VWA domain-containing protein [Myxococcales bacterium]
MRKLSTVQIAGILALVLVAIALAAPRRSGSSVVPVDKPTEEVRTIDLVIALDTSSSMDGLIDGARQKLWDVVSLLGQAKPKPALRVGLISYGNSGYDPATGWVRKDADLTSDLDGIYARLFALHTSGGSEYVARALQEATSRMEWSADPKALKIVFVAGNEPANQDPLVSVESAVAAARARGIYVNTIYCGGESSGEARLWQQVASLGAGRYAAIDQNSAVAIATPMDDELGRLSLELNKTYIGYGAGAAAGLANQAAQDVNAFHISKSAAAGRAGAKSSGLYENANWDLVDATKGAPAKIAAVPAAALPEPMRAMSVEERTKFVVGKVKERDEIQKKISTLAGKRKEFMKDARTSKPGAAKGIDDALEGAIIEQATSSGFKF